MAGTVQDAAAALTPAIRNEVNWFAQPGQRQFVDPETLRLIATGLISAFCTAMATGAGSETGKALVGMVRGWIAGKETPKPDAAEAAVAAAKAAVAAMPPPQIIVVMSGTEQAMREGFAQVMPKAKAEALAAQVHAQAAALVAAPPA